MCGGLGVGIFVSWLRGTEEFGLSGLVFMPAFLSACSVGALYFLYFILSRIEWTDEWLEVSYLFFRKRIMFNEVTDCRWRGAELCRLWLAGGNSLNLAIGVLGNFDELRRDLKAVLKPITRRKARAALERGELIIESRFLGIPVHRTRWHGSTLESRWFFSRLEVNLTKLRRAEIIVRYGNGFPGGETLALVDDSNKRHEFIAVYREFDVLIEVLRQVSPPGIPWIDFSSKTVDDSVDLPAKLTLTRAELGKAEKRVRGMPLVILGCGALLAVMLVNEVSEWMAKRDCSFREAIECTAMNRFLLIVGVPALLLYGVRNSLKERKRLREELARLEAEEAGDHAGERRGHDRAATG
jgi:hypothetical protein